jgi:hypothetical protein
MSDLDRFAGGITQKTPRFQKQHPDSEPPQPRYGDTWAQDAFGIPSLPGPAGAPPTEVYKRWR